MSGRMLAGLRVLGIALADSRMRGVASNPCGTGTALQARRVEILFQPTDRKADRLEMIGLVQGRKALRRRRTAAG